MNKKWAYKLVLGIAGIAITGGVGACNEITVRTVVAAKGNNKLHLSNVDNIDAHYVLDCRSFRAGARLYRNTSLGDTITGTYTATQNSICLTVLPDTVTRYFINCDELSADSANSCSPEDKIIREIIRSQKQR